MSTTIATIASSRRFCRVERFEAVVIGAGQAGLAVGQ